MRRDPTFFGAVLLALGFAALADEAAAACSDSDGDGVCDTVDDCPSLFDPEQGAPLRLNPTLVAGGAVQQFRLSPDAQRVVYLADQGTDEVFELYSVPTGGGPATKLNASLVPSGDVLTFAISADSSRVVYRADQDADESFDLYSVPIGGGTPIVLGTSIEPEYEIAPDSSRVVYCDHDPQWFDNIVMFSVPIAGGAKVKMNPALAAGNHMQGFVISPDSAWAAGRAGTQAEFLVWGRLDNGTTSSDPVGGLGVAEFSPDSARLIYDEEDPEFLSIALLSRPLTGGGVTPVSQCDPDDIARFVLVTPVPVGGHVRIVGKCSLEGIVWSARLTGGDWHQLSLDATQHQITSDGQKLVYAGQGLQAVSTLGGPATTLVPPGFPIYQGIKIAPDDAVVVFRSAPGVNGAYELYSVPIGGGAKTKLNGPLAVGGQVGTKFPISADSSTVVYVGDQDPGLGPELYAVPIGGGVALRLDSKLPGGSVRDDGVIAPDGSFVVYRGAPGAGPIELYRVRLTTDGDGDSVILSCDCDSGDGGVWTLPGEVRNLVLDRSGTTALLSFSAPEAPGAASWVYDTLKVDEKDGFTAGSSAEITCLESDGSDTQAADPEIPASLFFYLVRAENACGLGTAGSGHEAADAASCP